jgi:hypothetical protein
MSSQTREIRNYKSHDYRTNHCRSNSRNPFTDSSALRLLRITLDIPGTVTFPSGPASIHIPSPQASGNYGPADRYLKLLPHRQP